MTGKHTNKPDYTFSIPERHEILAFLKQAGHPRTLKHIAEALGVRTSDQRAALNKRLKAMVRDAQIIRNRREGYGLLDKMDLVAGSVIGHQDGFGFLRPDDGGDDVYLSMQEMRSLLHGDRAAVRISGYDKRQRRRGVLVEVLDRAHTTIVGRYIREDGISVVVPDNKRIHQDIYIPGGKGARARPGQFVVVKLIKQPDKHTQPIGEITEILGDHAAPGIATEIAIRAHELPWEWPAAVTAEIAGFDPRAKPDIHGRKDYRDLAFVTIDGEDARDFDDAVFCQPLGKGWRLLVAIADVSYYVQPGTALDQEAELRGTSVYFPDRVIPMLPEVLSNELCSLKPKVDRLCLVCELHINQKGKVKRYQFTEGVIRSAARLTYTEMAALVVDKKVKQRKHRATLVEHLDQLYELYKTLHRRRDRLGMLDFDSTESQLLFNDAGHVTDIKPLVRNDAHRLIEEFMLAANVAAAEFLLQSKLPILFRNHDMPSPEKLDAVREFLAELGLQLGGGKKPEAKHYAAVLDRVRSREDAHLIETVLLRSMALAVYGEENLGHFGLAFPAYTHFTSPIRRYPDLLVHRAIRFLITGRTHYIYSRDQMHKLGDDCSMTERRAEEATRDVEQRLKCDYMQDKVGAIFNGTISSVTAFGLFVELDDIYVEGLVHVTSLPIDYYHFDAVGHRLKGERTGKTFRLAGRVRVQVVRVDVDEKKIDFELVE